MEHRDKKILNPFYLGAQFLTFAFMTTSSNLRAESQRLALSVLLHGVVAAMLLSMPAELPDDDQLEEAIEIEIVPIMKPPVRTYISPSETEQGDVQKPEIKQPEQETEEAVEIDQNGFVHPGKMLSTDVLAMSNNKKARLALAEIGREEKWEQICMLEAMEQLSAFDADLTPDLLHSYSFEFPNWEGRRQIADGAAFFAQGQWYRLAYICQLAQARDEVADFSFKVGDPVPREDWESFNLVAEVMETAKGIERYNDGTRADGFKAAQ